MGLFDMLTNDSSPLVEEAFNHIREMLDVGHHMFAASTAFVLDNEILDDDLHALDRDINEREQALRRAVLKHLTMNPTQEMVFSLKLLSIVHEAERIGDLSKSLKQAGGLAHAPRMGDPVEPLRDVRDRILQMFDHARRGFVDEDVEEARVLMEMHEQIKVDVTDYLTQVANRDDLSANAAVVYALTARLLSRVSSHLSNIASSVAAPFDQIRRAPG